MPAVTRLGDLCTGHGAFPPRPSTGASPNVFVNGIAVHRKGDSWASALYTTTGNISLNGLATQAGGDWAAALTAGDRVLVKAQAVGASNGLYVAAAGAWARAAASTARSSPRSTS